MEDFHVLMSLIWFVVMFCFWPGFAVMNLIRFQLWFRYGFRYVSWCGSKLWFGWGFICACGILCTWLACFRLGNANSSMVGAQLGKTQLHPHDRIKTVSKSYQNHKNHREIDQKHVPGFWMFPFLKPTHRNHIKITSKIVSKSYQNRIKTISKPYQNHIKTTKTLEKSSKSLSRGCFCFLSWSQPMGNPEKGAPFPNHIKTISKSYIQNHI